MIILPRRAIAKSPHFDILDQQVEKTHNLVQKNIQKSISQATPFTGKSYKDVAASDKTRPDLLFIYKPTEGTFIKVTISIHAPNGKSGNTVCVKLLSALMP